MVDGSHLSFEDNLALTCRVVKQAHAKGLPVEAEIGRLSGTEDGITVEEYEARLTSVDQVGLLNFLSQPFIIYFCISLPLVPHRRPFKIPM